MGIYPYHRPFWDYYRESSIYTINFLQWTLFELLIPEIYRKDTKWVSCCTALLTPLVCTIASLRSSWAIVRRGLSSVMAIVGAGP
jgi:hypothetical protein